MVEASIDVDVDVRAAYDQWSRVEEIPRFLDGVTAVTITEQWPDERIAWVSVDAGGTAGAVTFEPLGEGRTRVRLELEGGPEQDLRRFKELVEQASPAIGVDVDLTGMVDDAPGTTETWN